MSADEVILGKLHHLRESCTFLREVQPTPLARFREDRMLRLAVERALQEAIEACLDIARRVLLMSGQPLPDTNRELFSALAGLGILRGEGVQRFAEMAGFRNVLVHEYDRIDLRVVHQVLRHRLGDLEGFGRAILSLLEERGPTSPPH